MATSKGDAKGTRSDRMQMPSLGEWHDDVLTVEAFICSKSKPAHANNLLRCKIQEIEPETRRKVSYLAEKRGIGADELWKLILANKANSITPEEQAEMNDK